MHVLITGADGFVGTYLRNELEQHSHQVSCLSGPPPPNHTPRYPVLDLRNETAVADCIADIQPDACIHLAGIASSSVCENNPALAFDVNVTGTLHLLTAFAKHAPKAKLLLISTTLVYGPQNNHQPVTENTPQKPINIYAISKATMEQAAQRFAEKNNLSIIIARPENHIGPGQSNQYVVIAFANQLAQIATGTADPTIHVGNLQSTRDFCDVRDVVRAYRLLLEKGTPGATYNIASGHPIPIQNILDHLIKLSQTNPTIQQNPDYWRPTDQATHIDTTAIQTAIDWTPKIPLETSLKDILDSLQKNT